MAIYGKPIPKTNVGKLFVSQLTVLREHNKDEELAILNQKNPLWYRPAEWDSSWLDIPSYHPPFSRTQHEDEFVAAVSDPDEPGTTGDLPMVEVQGDWLHVMERAFRARMFSPVRGRVQAAGRKMGHHHPQGVIKEGLIGYVVNIDRLNKGEKV